MQWLASFRTILENTNWLLSYSSQKYFSIKKEYTFKSTTVMNRKVCMSNFVSQSLARSTRTAERVYPISVQKGLVPSPVLQNVADRNLDMALFAHCMTDEASAIIPSLVNAGDRKWLEEPRLDPGAMSCWMLRCGFDMA